MGIFPTLLLDDRAQTCAKQCHVVSSKEAALTASSTPDRCRVLLCVHTSILAVLVLRSFIHSTSLYGPTLSSTVLGVRDKVVNIKGTVLILTGR